MKDLIIRYTSRKLVLTVAGGIALFTVGAYDQLVLLILGYLGVEGGADIVRKYKSRTLTAADIQAVADDFEVDTSKVETGKPKPTPMFDQDEKE